MDNRFSYGIIEHTLSNPLSVEFKPNMVYGVSLVIDAPKDSKQENVSGACHNNSGDTHDGTSDRRYGVDEVGPFAESLLQLYANMILLFRALELISPRLVLGLFKSDAIWCN